MKRLCPECGEEYTGRADKKYCSAACRATYHNRQNAEELAFQRNVNNILRHNRNVLAELNPEGKANVRKERLIDRGFKFYSHDVLHYLCASLSACNTVII